ncbi:hypothetical protein HNP29_000830 [Pseudomonas alcaligenes]|nr:hypothetical protein [Pseudomonas alcaligenes]
MPFSLSPSPRARGQAASGAREPFPFARPAVAPVTP